MLAQKGAYLRGNFRKGRLTQFLSQILLSFSPQKKDVRILSWSLLLMLGDLLLAKVVGCFGA
jgi:hypothetical protein